MKQVNWKLYFIADFETSKRRDLVWIVNEAVKGGATVVQLRAKSISTREFLDIGKKIHSFLKKKGIPFIINDRIDIALALDADGVHLGQNDMPLQIARKILGKEKIIGISVNNIEEAVEAENNGADYLGVGPVFPTTTKPDIRAPLGIEGLKKIRKKVKIPIVAIGGINENNIREVCSIGVDGVAVISAIVLSSDPCQSARKLIKEWDSVQ
ncbi:thiamine phosphate synthase [Candidatus Aminicenantes bacterium AC-335-K20]|jgi:thiamine-phosphate pyrophosphorylase|nr:thiamine phosphate synthase [SCandidatus Aminicenantes bacterium Aminicenantia_JdfR_composite]MCP2597673.1 thiamine phosphate synthase [Candidatus Aminicenantes bacterium AC-335-G13]MCP2598701.1 thiamine phosphate synthase [Candidatus Aminicenantes bacterium AC-335-L06]MCP2617998.1 thiamine phosphate synthase [Candidatus Aminicenantes bacterium AC-335-A11]MCP2619456.1 thiamine phosphate synthase [Candidatus Aminicenantes bacterium AC-335-K20]MCP2620698.1 thiamine phosphate synthase [Candida